MHINFYCLVLTIKFVFAEAIIRADVVDKSKRSYETSLSPHDFANPQKEVNLTDLGIASRKDPTLGKLVEGDIVTRSRRQFSDSGHSSFIARSSVRDPNRRWPSNEIPYAISSQYGPYARSIIAQAMQVFHEKTCIRFIARNPDKHVDYAFLAPDEGCFSEVGKAGGRQLLSLNEECLQIGVVIHELNHVVGFFHEQSRSDRDDYVAILWENIRSGAQDQFEKYGQAEITHLGEPYDYSSIMHYGPDAFGDGAQTIVPLKSGGENMGQRDSLSVIDLRKINKMYKCSSRKVKPIESTTMETPPRIVDPQPEIAPKESTGTEIIDHKITQCQYDSSLLQRCPRSCNFCTSSPSLPMTNNKLSCQDRNPSCGVWKLQGYCSHPHFRPTTTSQCGRSCGQCKEQEEKVKQVEEEEAKEKEEESKKKEKLKEVKEEEEKEKEKKKEDEREMDIPKEECKNNGGWLTCKLAWLLSQCHEKEFAKLCRRSCDQC